jgi:general secretion pathway protein F
MTIFGSIILTVCLTVIVPNITSMFTQMERTLPAPTRILITVSDLFKFYWWVILIFLGFAFYAIRRANRTSRGKSFFDRLKLSLPIMGTLSRKLTVARFSRTLSSLLENGVTMMTSLEIVKNIVGNVHISKAIDETAIEVGKGQGLGQSLSNHDIFPHLAVQMVQVGEQSGELEAMLKKLSAIYESESEAAIIGITSLLEPLLILLMGLGVGIIVISILLPILEMSQLVV